GASPKGDARTDLLVALARLPRGVAPEQASLLRALAEDLRLGFDPLDCDLGMEWTGARPATLVGDAPWRTVGDTIERLETLARGFVEDASVGDPPPHPSPSRGEREIGLASSTAPPPLRGRVGRGVGPELMRSKVVLGQI